MKISYKILKKIKTVINVKDNKQDVYWFRDFL